VSLGRALDPRPGRGIDHTPAMCRNEEVIAVARFASLIQLGVGVAAVISMVCLSIMLPGRTH
jgi:hypothetical protein